MPTQNHNYLMMMRTINGIKEGTQMKKKYNHVYQFKITLGGSTPPIWRRIQVPETYSFWDLHVAIQDAMGWSGNHLHEFEVVNPSTGLKQTIGTPNDDAGINALLDRRQKIADYFSMTNELAYYVYDFGDAWEHEILLEKILPRVKGVKYPICLKGRRACPPEDCGGIWGYEELLEIIKDPEHGEHEEMLELLGGDNFDPAYFNVNEVTFRDPDKRLMEGLE
ncbi:pRiA4b ORF-3-like protein [Candidatus Methanophagaceae archaeon]|nr:pRiA4b ORF-3-like protein [Methanophagales archaeon]